MCPRSCLPDTADEAFADAIYRKIHWVRVIVATLGERDRDGSGAVYEANRNSRLESITDLVFKNLEGESSELRDEVSISNSDAEHLGSLNDFNYC